MKCSECSGLMKKVDRKAEMAELDEDVTEGQFADYIAAEESGDFGAWEVGIIEYFCPKCETTAEFITDYLKSYKELIYSWHKKSKEGDYFSRYIFEYLAFNALLKCYLAISAEYDREAIQDFKRNHILRDSYLYKVKHIPDLQKSWKLVIKELKRVPLHNVSRDYDNPEIGNYWNNDTSKGHRFEDKNGGLVHSLEDWPNMVEFWYSVRNNLFHGGKNPNIKRDCFMVEQSYKTLSVFMKDQIQNLSRSGQ